MSVYADSARIAPAGTVSTPWNVTKWGFEMTPDPHAEPEESQQFREWLERKNYSWPDDVWLQRNLLDEYLLEVFNEAGNPQENQLRGPLRPENPSPTRASH